MSIFARQPLTWLSYGVHKSALVRGRRYLVCDFLGHCGVCTWSGADFLLNLGGFDQAAAREAVACAYAAAALEASLRANPKRRFTAEEEERIVRDFEDYGLDAMNDAEIYFDGPGFFMALPAPPGPEMLEVDEVPAAVFDSSVALLTEIEKLVMEHEAKRYFTPAPEQEEPPAC